MTDAGVGLGDLAFVNPQSTGDGIAGWYAPVPASAPRPLPRAGEPSGDLDALGVEVAGAGRMLGLPELVAATHTTSLLVLVGGRLVLEWYADGLGPGDRFLGASMTKSVLAHLVGVAVDAGALGLDDRVVEHVPELARSGYAEVTVRQVASMTTGVDWVEDHRDRTSAASRLVACFRGGAAGPGGGGQHSASRALLCRIGPGARPGTRFEYCTADSQVLDWVRERATDTPYARALAALWGRLGCADDAAVGLDGPEERGGVAMAGGGLVATARDWARIGLLQVDGRVADRAVLSPRWVEQSCLPAARFCEPGRLPSSLSTHVGFGMHWWPLDRGGRRVAADGSRGQFTYVDRDLDVVVVKTSQWPYDEPTDRQCRDLTYLALPEIARAAAG